jgi:hypothetical protein
MGRSKKGPGEPLPGPNSHGCQRGETLGSHLINLRQQKHVPRKSEAAPVGAMSRITPARAVQERAKIGRSPRSPTLQGLRRGGGIDLSQNHLRLMDGQGAAEARHQSIMTEPT